MDLQQSKLSADGDIHRGFFGGQRGLDDLDHVVQVQPFRGADRGDADFIAAPQELISRRSRVVAVGDNVLRPVYYRVPSLAALPKLGIERHS